MRWGQANDPALAQTATPFQHHDVFILGDRPVGRLHVGVQVLFLAGQNRSHPLVGEDDRCHRLQRLRQVKRRFDEVGIFIHHLVTHNAGCGADRLHIADVKSVALEPAQQANAQGAFARESLG
jgi:hypothetical protein